MTAPGDLLAAARLFDPERLTLARELRGFSRQELADKVGKTPGSVAQFEVGRARPDGQTLGRLALALAMPAHFFGNPGEEVSLRRIPLDRGHFRGLRSATQRARKQLLARGALLCALLSLLEQHVELPLERISALAAAPATPEDIELLAVEVRRRLGLGLGPIGNVVNLLERCGTVVLPIAEDCREVDAFSLWHERRPFVFLLLDRGSTSRSRMDAAHELGHLIMHTDSLSGSPELERQANHFGAAFLMPRESFLHEAPRSLRWELVWELKRRWKVSAAAIVRRSHELGILPESAYRRAFIQLNQSGERTHEPHEPPGETPVVLRKALDIVAPSWPLARIAEQLGLHTADLQYMTAFALRTTGLAGPLFPETADGGLPRL